MNQEVQEFVRNACGAYVAFHLQDLRSLWSGYGKIMRYGLKGANQKTVIVKHVQLEGKGVHPRGWNTDISHIRKVRSYHVESTWYRNYAANCGESCRVPACYGLKESDTEFLMVLEDLDASGFQVRVSQASLQTHIQSGLKWLANFHATYMGVKPDGLWPVGSYWHLDTRPDEWAAIEDDALKAAASGIDDRLNAARYQGFVHGDAKLENFCFSKDGKHVAAVDFQYVGGGCGIKDVAYFLSSCLSESECQQHETTLLDVYFSELKQALESRKSDTDFEALETEWRALYDFAWADFYRFLVGWSPGHWKIHRYSASKLEKVLAKL